MNNQFQNSIPKIFISVSQRRKDTNKIGIELCVFVSLREIKLPKLKTIS